MQGSTRSAFAWLPRPPARSPGPCPLALPCSKKQCASWMIPASVLGVEVLRIGPDTRREDYESVLEAGSQLGARHISVNCDDPDIERASGTFAALTADDASLRSAASDRANRLHSSFEPRRGHLHS